MKLNNRVLFVLIGGTGCRLGALTDRRIREEICGVDGTAFQRLRPGAQRYELPACIQFVYIDINLGDLAKVREWSVPDPRHVSAADATAHHTGLVTSAAAYPELADNLRLHAGPETESWLPPPIGEPYVTPLWRGAGQFPTIAQAVVYEILATGPQAAVGRLKEAIDRLASPQAASDLHRMAGAAATGDASAVDVFVGFSVAGGTGCGLFLAYLHLIAELFSRTTLKPMIYPLVLLPSAFEEGLGGGRAADLNAARALLELFRLIDRQNRGTSVRSLRSDGAGAPADAQADGDDDPPGLWLPGLGQVRMRPGLAQSAFLFSRPQGISPEDLRHSVVELVLSLIGAESGDRTAAGVQRPQSFADSFLNRARDRMTPASDGIGDRGVSTALAASLRVPVEELADLVAGRLLAEGVEQLAAPLGAAERNRQAIEQFFTHTGLHDLLNRPAEAFVEPEPVVGARRIILALGDRFDAMQGALARLRSDLDARIPDLVERFDPDEATARLLNSYDPFRVQRIVFGHPALGSEVEREGVYGLMVRRREPPPAPKLDDGRDVTAALPDLRDRRGGFAPVRWDDPEPAKAREEQDRWFQWQTRVHWTRPWSQLAAGWQPRLDRTRTLLSALTTELSERARLERERQGGRADRLRGDRAGATHLLPSGGDLERFQKDAISQLIDAKVEEGVLPGSAREGDLLHALLTPDGWREAFAQLRVDGSANAAERAVDALRTRLRHQIRVVLQAPGKTRGPLIPRLTDLLAETAHGAQRFTQDDLEYFKASLAGLVPKSFRPQGPGELRVLVTYPAAAPDPAIDKCLREIIQDPQEQIIVEFAVTTTESVSIVMQRTSMGITEVPEVRKVLRTWADAIERPQPQDFLRWRQRTGYDFGHLATSERHRVEILHRLLAAAWNDRLVVEGDPASPISVTVRMTDEIGATMYLQPLDRASSWGSLLRAYESFTIADDTGLRQDVCARLMREVPDGVGTHPKPPGDVYRLIRTLAPEQIAVIDRMLDGLHPSVRARALQMRAFWARTLTAALEREFTEVMAIRPNLLELEKTAMGQEW